MHIKKQEIKKETVLLDGRLVIQPMMEDKELSPTFESMWAKIPPRTETDDEYHPREEVNIVVSGQFTVEVGEESYQVEPGDVITIPSNVRHKVVNLSDAEGVWICLLWEPEKGIEK